MTLLFQNNPDEDREGASGVAASGEAILLNAEITADCYYQQSGVLASMRRQEHLTLVLESAGGSIE